MRNGYVWYAISGLLAVSFLPCGAGPCPAQDAEGMITHDVYFILSDDAPDTQEKLMAACHKYLTGHPGTIWFAAGPRAKELQGALNDRGFDVAVHLVFKNKAALEQYAVSERHQQFIEEAKSLWSKVRVFDSYATKSSHAGIETEGKVSPEHKVTLPDAAIGLAGMITGKVVQKLENGLVVQVAQVTKVWEHNKAEDAQSLVGHVVIVSVGHDAGNPARYVKLVHVGEEVTLDVAHQEGKVLALLELTEDQRERVHAATKDK